MDVFILIRKALRNEEESFDVNNLSCVIASRVFMSVRTPSTEFVALTDIRRVISKERAEV